MDAEHQSGWYRLTHVHVLSVFAVMLGAAIGVGGETRFTDPRLPGSEATVEWWIWSAGFILYGVTLLLTERWRFYWAVLLAGAVPYSFIVLSFIQVSQVDPTVAFTGIAVYGTLWMMHIIDVARHGFYQYTLYRWVSKRLERDRARLEKLSA